MKVKRRFAILPRRRLLRFDTVFVQQGWYWFRFLNLTYNIHHGWLAFADDNDEDLR